MKLKAVIEPQIPPNKDSLGLPIKNEDDLKFLEEKLLDENFKLELVMNF